LVCLHHSIIVSKGIKLNIQADPFLSAYGPILGRKHIEKTLLEIWQGGSGCFFLITFNSIHFMVKGTLFKIIRCI
jgi:hypothetical protein